MPPPTDHPNNSRTNPFVAVVVAAVTLLLGIGLCGSSPGGLNGLIEGALLCLGGGVGLIAALIWLSVRASDRRRSE